jgi:2-oxoacid:acceptor oxidoreductase delta subunit (pyruvate/2-ketoisovalerate family)
MKLNLNCTRDNQASIIPSDLEAAQRAPLSPREATEEAKRCIGFYTCEACDLCRFMCPDLAIIRDPDSGAIVIDLDYCKGCGICALICPKGAITMVKES